MSPRAYLILLLLASFTLGYLLHSHPLFSRTANDLAQHHTFPSNCSDPIPSTHVRQIIIDRVFSGTSPWANFPPPHVSHLLQENWTYGWGSQDAVFENLIKQVQPKTIIEVGTFVGASAIHMADLTRRLGLDSQIICIDDFRGWWTGMYWSEKSVEMTEHGDSALLYQFMQNVIHANASESITFLPFSATTALNGLCDWGVYGDLVEIDAAHDFHSAWVDINNGYKVVKKPGGVLFGHDYKQWEGVRKAVDIFARLHGFRIRVDGQHWVLY